MTSCGSVRLYRLDDWQSHAGEGHGGVHRTRRAIGRCGVTPLPRIVGLCALLFAIAATAAAAPLREGLYEIEVRIHLPNVADTVAPVLHRRCLRAAEIAGGGAFVVMSDNPLATCPHFDYAVETERATFRIVCPGPNRGWAKGSFDLPGESFRGEIVMNLGGKNMTMSETQRGRRLGACLSE